MRPSRVLNEMRAGKIATIAKLNILHPAVIDLCGLANYSGVWICNEHGPNDWSTIDHCIRAGKEHDLDVIVRVSKGSYSDYIKPFEADAAGIMVPHVTCAEEARWIVEQCRCHPVGKRPMDGGNADGRYCQHSAEEYIHHCNQEKLIILQIESPEGADAAEEIAAVPGYDCLLFGPGDFSHRIGKFGQIQDKTLLQARSKVEKAARAHGKFNFAVAVPGGADELLQKGYHAAAITADVTALAQVFQDARKSFLSGSNGDPIYQR